MKAATSDEMAHLLLDAMIPKPTAEQQIAVARFCGAIATDREDLGNLIDMFGLDREILAARKI